VTDSSESRPPDDVDLLVARLGLHVASAPMQVLDEWTLAFERMRADGRDADCARLLAAAKGWALPDAQAGIVAFSDGWLLARRRHSRRAIRAFGRALGAFTRAGIEPAKPMVLAAIAAEHEVLGELENAAQAPAEAERVLDERKDRTGAARIALDSVTLTLNRDKLSDEELQGLERRTRDTIETFSSAGDAVNEARAKLALAFVLGRRGQAGEAQRELVEAAGQAAGAGDLLTHHQAIGELGNLAMAAGLHDEAAELLQAALKGLLRARDLSSVGRTHASLGALAELRGAPDEAARHRAEAFATYEALEDTASAERMRRLLGTHR